MANVSTLKFLSKPKQGNSYNLQPPKKNQSVLKWPEGSELSWRETQELLGTGRDRGRRNQPFTFVAYW